MKSKESIINYLTSTIENSEVAYAQNPDEFLSLCSDIICQFDTDIAIGVMEKLTKRFGEIAKQQALSIKVNNGY